MSELAERQRAYDDKRAANMDKLEQQTYISLRRPQKVINALAHIRACWGAVEHVNLPRWRLLQLNWSMNKAIKALDRKSHYVSIDFTDEAFVVTVDLICDVYDIKRPANDPST